MLPGGGDEAVGDRGHPAPAADRACRGRPTGSWTGRGCVPSPPSWAGRPGRRRTMCWPPGVEAVVLPLAAGLSITELRRRTRAELIKADPAAADRRRKKARRDADVTVRGLGDGMGELRSVMSYPDAAATRAAVDARARALKAAGDERPIGQLRTEVLHALVTRPGDERPGVSAHLIVTAGLDSLESAA